MGGKEMHMFMVEFPRMFEHMAHRYIEKKSRRVKPAKASKET
jgi:hypothetical protein